MPTTAEQRNETFYFKHNYYGFPSVRTSMSSQIAKRNVNKQVFINTPF